MPAAPHDARIIMVGTYDADAIASASVGGPEAKTNLIDVRVEPGRGPLYLVLTSYESMIWRITGATSRVLFVTRASLSRRGTNGSGVIGVARDRVVSLPSHRPRYFSKTSEADPARATVRRSLGRDPDAVFGTYSAQSVVLPRGEFRKADRDATVMPVGFDPAMWQEALRFWPGGLVKVDHRRVIAAAPVTPYRVLPSQMGLAQLLGAGAMRRDGRHFVLTKPIAQMPPSMGGRIPSRSD